MLRLRQPIYRRGDCGRKRWLLFLRTGGIRRQDQVGLVWVLLDYSGLFSATDSGPNSATHSRIIDIDSPQTSDSGLSKNA